MDGKSILKVGLIECEQCIVEAKLFMNLISKPILLWVLLVNQENFIITRI